MRLNGKRAVITGASRGLGRAVAEAFLNEGATVLICARNADDLAETQCSLHKKAQGRVFGKKCDVAIASEVDALAAEARACLGGADILVANAGIYGPKGPVEDIDWGDWLNAIGINLIGAAYCCRAFLPLLKEAQGGKMLLLSGGGATKPMPFLSAYAASKAGIVRFGETLAHELEPFGIDVNMIAPGALNTRMLDEVLEAGPGKVGEAYYQSALRQKESGGAPLHQAAALCVHLASSAGNGITGRLISAQWDPWRRLEALRDELTGTDIYTLRRIVPDDRGKDWDRQ
jgi:NAD(P)-dependent dehydrogenase (short-subunit alcohol dehydrogenase family)